MWYCYILRCIDENHENLTYNGSTNDVIRRIRQHCGARSGGAKATSGKQWEVYALISGFFDHVNCLSMEWRIRKPLNKKRTAIHCGVKGRIKGLSTVLMLDKWTSKCKIENKNCNYKVHIVEDLVEYLDIDAFPDNIEVITVKKMDDEFLRSLESKTKVSKVSKDINAFSDNIEIVTVKETNDKSSQSLESEIKVSKDKSQNKTKKLKNKSESDTDINAFFDNIEIITEKKTNAEFSQSLESEIKVPKDKSQNKTKKSKDKSESEIKVPKDKSQNKTKKSKKSKNKSESETNVSKDKSEREK
jgi:predicted GIY-YIG superfamily endonuclease